MREEKILISRDGPDSNVLKFKPPMVFTSQDADRVVDTLDRVLAEFDGNSIPVTVQLEVRVTPIREVENSDLVRTSSIQRVKAL